MKNKTSIRLPLTDVERANLRKNKIKIANILDFATDELEVLLNATPERAKEIYALAEFQTVPSVGIKFAEDLVCLGYYSLNELKEKDGAKLTDEYEQKKGYWVDPCVEDQFRLVVNFANTNGEQREKPDQNIKEFFIDHHLYETRRYICELVNTAITSEHTYFEDAADRRLLLTFQEGLMKFI
jgi:hypothetical protein